MNAKKNPRPRLKRSDWLEAALEFLHSGGVQAVTVDALASRLNISRGSFYHHFRDRSDLSQEMLEHWKRKWTVEIRDDIAALGMDGLQTLAALGKLIRHRQGAGYDIAVRAWAVHDETAGAVVAEVDRIRLDFIRSQFRKIGFKGLELENRSRLFLYYTMTEPAFFDPVDEKNEQELDRIRLQLLAGT